MNSRTTINALPGAEFRLGSEPVHGEQSAQQLLPLVYEELRKLAAARMAAEWDTCTLQPTALVHEAYLRLSGPNQGAWKNRAHFFVAAAEAMRRVLIDHARAKRALKRRGGWEKVNLDGVEIAAETNDETLLVVDEAVQKLARLDPQSAELVKLRYFIGMSNEEAARALGISERSAKRWWTFARAWLYREISASDSDAAL
jgi:RNA polymerase sigma factor (TIGR02999 family)